MVRLLILPFLHNNKDKQLSSAMLNDKNVFKLSRNWTCCQWMFYRIVYSFHILGILSFSRGTCNILSRRCRQPVLSLHSHSIAQKTVSKFKDVMTHNKFEGLFHYLGEEVGWKFFVLFFNPFFNLACTMVLVNFGVHLFCVISKEFCAWWYFSLIF